MFVNGQGIMAQAVEQVANMYLSFKLDDEVFGVSIGRVREVLTFTKLTPVPCTPSHVRGVINLRGLVVPVVDLKTKFGIGVTESSLSTCVVIVTVEFTGEDLVVGFLADSLQEVFDLDSSDIEPSPRMGTRINPEFIMGMGKRQDDFTILLDVDKLFTAGSGEGFFTESIA